VKLVDEYKPGEADGWYVVEQCQCPSSCVTQDHENWRECVKANNLMSILLDPIYEKRNKIEDFESGCE